MQQPLNVFSAIRLINLNNNWIISTRTEKQLDSCTDGQTDSQTTGLTDRQINIGDVVELNLQETSLVSSYACPHEIM